MKDRYDIDRMFHNENATGDPFIDADGAGVSADEDLEIGEARDLGLDPLVFCDECDYEGEGDSDY